MLHEIRRLVEASELTLSDVITILDNIIADFYEVEESDLVSKEGNHQAYEYILGGNSVLLAELSLTGNMLDITLVEGTRGPRDEDINVRKEAQKVLMLDDPQFEQELKFFVETF